MRTEVAKLKTAKLVISYAALRRQRRGNRAPRRSLGAGRRGTWFLLGWMFPAAWLSTAPDRVATYPRGTSHNLRFTAETLKKTTRHREVPGCHKIRGGHPRMGGGDTEGAAESPLMQLVGQ